MKTTLKHFCKYCKEDQFFNTDKLTYEFKIKNIISTQIIRCDKCKKQVHQVIQTHGKNMAVSLITQKISRSQLRKLQAERARVDRLTYKYWEVAVTDRVIYQEKYGKGKVSDDTYAKLMKLVRKQIWKAICNIDKYGKRHDVHYSMGDLKNGKREEMSHEIKDANSNDIKYCGDGKTKWNLCPNRFAYITRPEVLEKVYGNYVTFISNKGKYPQVMSYEVSKN